MSAAGKENLDVKQTAGYSITFQFCDPADDGSLNPGPPVDVTGWTALLQVRANPGTTVILELTDTAGITVGTTDGTFEVNMTGEQTALITQDAKYDLFATPPGEQPVCIVEGSVNIDLAISVPA